MTASAYFGTYQARFGAMQAERNAEQLDQQRRDRWKLGGKPYLPEAPEGMERISLKDNPLLFADLPGEDEEEEKVGAELDEALEVARSTRWSLEQDPHSWGYIKGDEVVMVSIYLRNASRSNSLQGMIATSLKGQGSSSDPYAVIGGVAFGETKNYYSRERNTRVLVLHGAVGLGERAVIKVRARSLRRNHPYGACRHRLFQPERAAAGSGAGHRQRCDRAGAVPSRIWPRASSACARIWSGSRQKQPGSSLRA